MQHIVDFFYFALERSNSLSFAPKSICFLHVKGCGPIREGDFAPVLVCCNWLLAVFWSKFAATGAVSGDLIGCKTYDVATWSKSTESAFAFTSKVKSAKIRLCELRHGFQ